MRNHVLLFLPAIAFARVLCGPICVVLICIQLVRVLVLALRGFVLLLTTTIAAVILAGRSNDIQNAVNISAMITKIIAMLTRRRGAGIREAQFKHATPPPPFRKIASRASRFF